MSNGRLFVMTLAALTAILLAFQSIDNIVTEKINGVSFVAPVRPVEADEMKPVQQLNANWVTLMPFAFGRSDGPELRFNNERQWWGEREAGISETINHAHQLGLKVLIKPHVWLRGAGWPGEFTLESEEQWKQWEKNYRSYIISYAKLSESLGVEMFSIGTEYRIAVVERPDFWEKLIKEVRSVYSGKLTYASNWDNYQNVGFWSEVDYIGIDSYFDLSPQKEPTAAHLKEQWKPIKKEMQIFSESKSKPIIFTEFGYQSVDYTADGHWKYGRGERPINMQAQATAYRALFETFWDEPWFAGGFLWKWFDQHERRGGANDSRFTPQNKPAEQTIREWYGRY